MKHGFLVLASALIFISHSKAQTLPAACGDARVQYKVKTVRDQALPAMQAGQGQVIILQSLDGAPGQPVSRVGVDGAWAGAVRGASYAVVSVAPGVHHLCMSRQSGIASERDTVGTLNFNAQPGKTYVFEFHITRSEVGDADMQGGSMLPGQYPGSMTAKEKPTTDSATLTALSEENGKLRLRGLPVSNATAK